jgi:hypothetical protein
MIWCGWSTNSSGGLGIVKKIQDVIHEVILVWIFLVVKPCLESLLKYCNYISAVGCWHELKGALNFFAELISPIRCLLLHIDFVGNADAGNVWALIPHFSVPCPQVLVCYLTSHIKHHNANVCAKVVRWVQLVEWLLTSGVPYVYAYSYCKKEQASLLLTDVVRSAFNGVVVAEHCQSVSRWCTFLTKLIVPSVSKCIIPI